MKIVTACLAHETNTFAPTPTTLADFGRNPPGPAFPAGGPILNTFRGTRTVHGGAIDVAEREGVTIEPLLHVFATPSGMVRQDAFDELLDLVLTRLRQHGNADGLLLDLHGAMVTEQHQDAEGRILAAVREVVGPDLPVALVLDLHANTTAEMARHADILIGYDLYPHTDLYERGVEATELLLRTCRGEVQPALAYRQLPLLTMPPRQCTLIEPMRTMLHKLWAVESVDRVLTGTVAMGFPFSDIRDVGASVVVVTDGDADLAATRADELACFLWGLREQFEVDLVPVDAVIRYVLHRATGPVILADGSDNPGGGAPCDGTVILEELVDANVPDSVVAVIADPETAQQAHDAGVGSNIHAHLGAKTDLAHGRTLEVEAYVKHLSDGHFTYRAEMAAGAPGEMGPTAVLVIGSVKVIVTTERVQVWDPEILRCVGIEPAEQRLLALKSAVHYRAAFGPLAERVFDADTPGVHRPDFGSLTYRQVRRPIYPLDAETEFAPSGAAG